MEPTDTQQGEYGSGHLRSEVLCGGPGPRAVDEEWTMPSAHGGWVSRQTAARADGAVAEQGRVMGPWEFVGQRGPSLAPVGQGRLPGESGISALSGRVRRCEPGTLGEGTVFQEEGTACSKVKGHLGMVVTNPRAY